MYKLKATGPGTVQLCGSGVGVVVLLWWLYRWIAPYLPPAGQLKGKEVYIGFDLVNQHHSNNYFMTLIGEISRSREYNPFLLSRMLDPSSPLLDTTNQSWEVCIVATTVLYVYRALGWMTKGPDFDGVAAAATWAEYAQEFPVDDGEESLLALFDADFWSPIPLR